MICSYILSYLHSLEIAKNKLTTNFEQYMLFKLLSIVFYAYLLLLMFSLIFTYPVYTFSALFVLYYFKPFCKKSLKGMYDEVKNNFEGFKFIHLVVFVLIAAPLLIFSTSILVGMIVD